MRPLKLLTIFLVSLSLLGIIPVISFSAKPKDGLQKGQEKNPIEIHADKLRSENEGKKIIFSGRVVSTWGNLEIKSDFLEVYANPKTKGKKENKVSKNQPQQDIDKVIATGNVRVKKGDRHAKGDRAEYDNKAQSIIITGKPYASTWQGKNIIKNPIMIFYLDKNLVEIGTGTGEDRVIAVFAPNNPPSDKQK